PFLATRRDSRDTGWRVAAQGYIRLTCREPRPTTPTSFPARSPSGAHLTLARRAPCECRSHSCVALLSGPTHLTVRSRPAKAQERQRKKGAAQSDAPGPK